MNNFKTPITRMGAAAGLLVCLASLNCLARSFDASDDNSAAGVIPSPNQEFGDSEELAALSRDLQRTHSILSSARSFPMAGAEPHQMASNEASVPVYVSPFERAERSAAVEPLVRPQAQFDASQESSHAPPNYAPRPVPSASSGTAADLKTSASYGHNHHGHYGHDHSGWLDMGAWTGGKGSFGWYADYPVGGKHHGHYGRK